MYNSVLRLPFFHKGAISDYLWGSVAEAYVIRKKKDLNRLTTFKGRSVCLTLSGLVRPHAAGHKIFTIKKIC